MEEEFGLDYLMIKGQIPDDRMGVGCYGYHLRTVYLLSILHQVMYRQCSVLHGRVGSHLGFLSAAASGSRIWTERFN